jgi:hypothetical protein
MINLRRYATVSLFLIILTIPFIILPILCSLYDFIYSSSHYTGVLLIEADKFVMIMLWKSRASYDFLTVHVLSEPFAT